MIQIFETQPSDEKINTTLAILSARKIDAGDYIRYQNKYYIPVSNKGTPYYLKKKTDCIVIQAFNSHLYVNIPDQLSIMQEVSEHRNISKEFDAQPIKKNKEKYIPH